MGGRMRPRLLSWYHLGAASPRPEPPEHPPIYLYASQIIMSYTLNLHSAVYQLYLNKLVKKKRKEKHLVYFINQDKCQFSFILIAFGRQTLPSNLSPIHRCLFFFFYFCCFPLKLPAWSPRACVCEARVHRASLPETKENLRRKG